MTAHLFLHCTDSSPKRRESDAARQLASRLEQVFVAAFRERVPRSPRRTGYSSHDRPDCVAYSGEHVIFNRDLAAHIAQFEVDKESIGRWFDATGLERQKHLYIALHLTPSRVSRAKPQTAFDPSVTERMLRQSELLVRAAQVFGEEGKTWMTKPHELLEGKTPLEYAANEFGGAKVAAVLNAIEYGGVV